MRKLRRLNNAQKTLGVELTFLAQINCAEGGNSRPMGGNAARDSGGNFGEVTGRIGVGLGGVASQSVTRLVRFRREN